MIPGEYQLKDGEIALCEGLTRITVTVANTGDRPIQIGSHYHFFEANPALDFDRAATRGHRLDVAAGTAIRFEPGQKREVTLIPFTGSRIAYGFRQQVMGALSNAPADARISSTAPEAARPSSSGDADQGESS